MLVTLATTGVATLLVALPSENGPSYRFLRERPGGAPFRWEPCRPILYEVNLAGSPAGALADVREAVARISRATGIRFVFAGDTIRTPEQQEQAGFRRDGIDYLPVLIAWVPSYRFRAYADPEEIVGVGYAHPGVGSESWVYKSGLVILNQDLWLPAGFVNRDSLGPTLMHELAHVLGLGHVGQGDELMWSPDATMADSFPDPFQIRWGDGDREGLRRLGRAAGCVSPVLV